MSTRLLSLVLLIAAFTLLWAMTPRRRRRRRRRRVDLEAMWQSLAYGGSSEAHDRYRIASEKVASGEWVDSSSERRRHSARRSRRRRPTRRWVVAIGAMLGITVVVGVLVSADVKPFSTFVERYMPSGRSQAPAPAPLPLVAHQTAINTPTAASASAPVPTATAFAPTQSSGVSIGPTRASIPAPSPTSQPRRRQGASALWTPTPIPSPTPSPTPHPDPSQRHIELKYAMLDLVNEKREWAGVPPVIMGDNSAVQLHAEQALANCIGAHWGVNGTKHYMRYSLAGGYQHNAENGSGSTYCPRSGERYSFVKPSDKIADAVEGWMNSPDHRRTMLNPTFKKLNIGLAWDDHSMFSYHHFEGNYVEFDSLPTISPDGVLHFEAQPTNGAKLVNALGKEEFFVGIHYDPPLKRLTRGQLARTYCVPLGERVASLRQPLTDGSSWSTDSSSYKLSSCPDPYDLDPNTPEPKTPQDASRQYADAKAASNRSKTETVTVPWITATVWDTRLKSLKIEADISEVLREHGDGIYTLMINAQVDGKSEWIAQYSIFRGVEAPAIYGGLAE